MAFTAMRTTVDSKQWGYRSVTTLFRVLEVSLVMPRIATPKKSFILELVHQNAWFAISFAHRDMSKLTIQVRHIQFKVSAPLGNDFEIFISEDPPVLQVV